MSAQKYVTAAHNKYRILLIHNQNRICNNVVEKQPVDVKMKEIEKEEVVNSDDDEEKGEVEVRKIKSYTDIMKMKVDKLMANPDKPVFIPERPKDRDVNKAQEFNHNIMGSSAGAGSGEFHLYRQMRRKEANRQAILGYRKRRDDANAEFHGLLEENEKAAAEKTAKKREKRQKKKANQKKKKKNHAAFKAKEESEESEPDSDEDEAETKEKDVKPVKDKVVKPPSVQDDPLMKEPPKKAPIVIQF